jgi:hypothetical protein
MNHRMIELGGWVGVGSVLTFAPGFSESVAPAHHRGDGAAIFDVRRTGWRRRGILKGGFTEPERPIPIRAIVFIQIKPERQMSSRGPSNGPSLSKPTYKASRSDYPSAEHKRIELEQTVRECDRTREFNKLSPKDKAPRLRGR